MTKKCHEHRITTLKNDARFRIVNTLYVTSDIIGMFNRDLLSCLYHVLHNRNSTRYAVNLPWIEWCGTGTYLGCCMTVPLLVCALCGIHNIVYVGVYSETRTSC